MKISVIGSTKDEWQNTLLSQLPTQASKRTIVLIGSTIQILLTPLVYILRYKILWMGNDIHNKKLVQLFLKLVSTLCHTILAPNQGIETKYLRIGIPSKKLILIYPSCILKSPTKITQNKLVLACDGSVKIEDGLATLIKSVSLAQEILGNIKLIIGGNVTERKSIEWLVQELKLKQVVQLVQTSSASWCEGSNIYMLPNEKLQKVPFSLVQALGFGQAIISIDNQSVREFIQPNKNGILLKKINADVLSQNIITLARNPNLLFKIGNSNFNFAKEKFAHEILENNLQNILL